MQGREVLLRGLRRGLGRVHENGSTAVAVPEYSWESAGRPRYGHGAPSHPGLTALFEGHADAFREAMETIASYTHSLAAISLRNGKGSDPYWLSEWMPGLDAASLYGFVRSREPKRYVEVGAGVSTRFSARARQDGELEMRITAIDPEPRAEVAALCDELVRRPLQECDLSVFAELEPGDIVFFDGSHRAVMNSDVVAFFFDVLPQLPPGVLVGVHDVFLPDDYLPEWATWNFSEQYVLAAYLLGEAPFLRPVLGTWYASHVPSLTSVLTPLWEDPRLRGVERRGWAFWAETVST
jgi:Methyltransferase domain